MNEISRECRQCNHKFQTANKIRLFCSQKCKSRFNEASRRKQAKNGDKKAILRILLRECRNKAKNRGIYCNIKVDDIDLPEYCPVFNIKLEFRGGDNSYSLDRIDSTKDYTPDNVQVISWRANRLKNNGTLEDFKKIVEWMEKNKNE